MSELQNKDNISKITVQTKSGKEIEVSNWRMPDSNDEEELEYSNASSSLDVNSIYFKGLYLDINPTENETTLTKIKIT